METTTILLLLFTHWVADFIFQTDEQAKGKSSSNWHLTAHVMTYTGGLLIFAVFAVGLDVSIMYWALLNAGLHWCTDWVTSRINSKLWKEQKVHWFFVSVGFDQLIHYACLILTYQSMLK